MKLARLALVGIALVSTLVVSTGCTKKTDQSSTSMTSAAKVSKEVHLGIWSNYVTPEMLAAFEKASGIKVIVSNYSSNEELLAKMQAGGAGFDVVVPSDYMVTSMIQLKLLKKLDPAKIPNAKSLEPRFLKKAYDPTNEFSLPFDWGTTGIAVNRQLYKGQVKGWKDLFESPELAGKIAFLDDAREVIGAALKFQGHSLNTKNAKDLEEAKKLLISTRKRVKLYSSESLLTLTNGEAAVTQAYVSDSMQARSKMNGQVDYILPAEGGTWWIDNLVIPASAEHADEAHQLINFLLEPKIVAMTVKTVFVSPTSQAAMSLLPPEILNNHAMFPSERDLSKFEMLQDLGDSMREWDKIWTELKATE
ncbi:MAG: PotD/PotF family extracellular solute-binding protein [Bdellovibrionia bacterium]